MLTSFQRSCLCILCFALVIGTGFNASRAVEVHAVGNAAYKCVDGEWTQTALERMGHMRAIWAFSEDDIYIGNDDGAVYNYDGSTWTKLFQCPSYKAVVDIWGTSNTNIYVCFGGPDHSTNGMMRHFDGSVWSDFYLPIPCDNYSAVYGFSDDDIYLVAPNGWPSNLLYHNDTGDPLSWEEVDIFSFGIWMVCTCVWGSSGDDVFVTGSEGEIIHWDGKRWKLMESGVTGYIRDIWGSGDSDVFAVLRDKIIHYDGNPRDEWTEMSIPSSLASIYWITGISSSDVIASGYKDYVLHYDGNVWTEKTCDEPYSSSDGFMFSADYTLMVNGSGTLFKYTGLDIERCDQEYGFVRGLWAVTCTPTGTFYAAGYEGFVYQYDGISWSELARPTTDLIYDIIAFADDDICILTYGGETFHFDGVSWELLGSSIMDSKALWGLSSDNLYMAAGNSIYHYDGNDWTRVWYQPCIEHNEVEIRCDYVYDIWGTSDSDIYAVGRYGETEYVWPETFWYSCGIIIHFDGAEWSYQPTGVDCPTGYPPSNTMELKAVWGSSADDIWTAGSLRGYEYLVLHSNGINWNIVEVPNNHYSAIWGTSTGSDVYFLRDFRGRVHHYDGVVFNEIDLTSVDLRDIWGTDLTSTHAETPQSRFSLLQNRPNPFNPSTTIRFSLKSRSNVSLTVYDVAGRLVNVLVDDVMDAGLHDVTWNGRGRAGRTVASGVYFYRLQAGEFIETRKMVLLR